MEAASAHLHTLLPVSNQSRNLATSFGIKEFRKVSESLRIHLEAIHGMRTGVGRRGMGGSVMTGDWLHILITELQ